MGGPAVKGREGEKACPKEVSISHIARFNREFLKAALLGKNERRL
jgi:hypothetical protein